MEYFDSEGNRVTVTTVQPRASDEVVQYYVYNPTIGKGYKSDSLRGLQQLKHRVVSFSSS